jgi:hypothetical protein
MRTLDTCKGCSVYSGGAAGPLGRQAQSSGPPPGRDVGSLQKIICDRTSSMVIESTQDKYPISSPRHFFGRLINTNEDSHC